jgi:hypothetical protein
MCRKLPHAGLSQQPGNMTLPCFSLMCGPEFPMERDRSRAFREHPSRIGGGEK